MGNVAALFAKNLKKYRKSKGWTQEKLAEYSNLALVTIAFLETAKNLPNKTTVQKLSKALEVDEELFFVSEHQTDELFKKMKLDLSREQLKKLVQPDLALEVLLKAKNVDYEALKKIVPPKLALEILSKAINPKRPGKPKIS